MPTSWLLMKLSTLDRRIHSAILDMNSLVGQDMKREVRLLAQQMMQNFGLYMIRIAIHLPAMEIPQSR